MTTRTKTERAAQSIRGYALDRAITIKANHRNIQSAITLGIFSIGHRRSDIQNISSWIDHKISIAIEQELQKLQNLKIKE